LTLNLSPASPNPTGQSPRARKSVHTLAGRLVGASARRPWTVAILVLALCVLALLYASQNFAMTTDTEALISSKVSWRRNEAAMDRAFPQNTDTILVVIGGATPEMAESAASRLAAALSADGRAFKHVTRPDGGPFFDREGLLFQSQAEVRATTDQILAAQGFLGPLAADPSLRGVMTSLSALATGVQQGQTSFKAIDSPLRAFTGALQSVEAGKPTFFSWQAMIANGAKGLAAPRQRFITVQPKLNYADLEPGADASDAIRAAAKALSLDPAHGVTVRLTGSVPLSDEEFASLEDKAWLVGGVMLGAMLLMLWLAVRSVQIVLAILLTTIGGLIVTAALGLLAVGRFNLISVAFIPLFVGLGVDFGIQLSVRFRAERLDDPAIPASLIAAADGVGGALALAATAIALGFFAFLPTAYVGVSELGVIAGIGMVVALALALTLLPALLVLLRPPLQTQEVGNRALAPVDRFLVERRGWVLWAFAAAMVLSIVSLVWVRFDFNPLHLKNPHGEAMATLNDLMKDPDQSPNTIDVLTPSLAAADALAKRLSALPEVSQAVTLSNFVPDDQAAKLALIENADLLLDPTLNPFDVQPSPSDADVVASLRQTASDLAAAASASSDPAALDAKRLASVLNQLAAAAPAVRSRATEALIPPLNTLLRQLRGLLQAQPETLATLPPALRADWIASDGRARIQVFPNGNANDNAALVRFSRAVQAAAPNASGGPISIEGAGATIAWSFIEAGVLSFAVITLLLLLVLRSFRETLFTLAPIVLSIFLTLGSCVVIGQPINFANIIAFPLLFGVGVAFHIYFVMAWRGGATDLLQSSLARAVFFSALTTGAAFGSLMLSSHPGTASMGKILMISLIWTLVCALLFEPALLGPPAARRASKPD
jgi:hopanoid biosynthesis associated RND transporter like protein HpnN